MSVIFALISALFTMASVLVVIYARNQRVMANQLAELASTDPLTGCINRREMYARVQRFVSPASGALMMMDLDNFKSINDNYEHAAGDLILVDFAARVRGCLRDQDWVARVGGEEFVVWLANVSDTGRLKAFIM